MIRPRYKIRSDWPFYLLVLAYLWLILNMTARLWFGDGINIFANYSDAASASDMIIDANKVYWAKTCFLFGLLLLWALNFDMRMAAGLGATFWAGSLMAIFAPSPVLLASLAIGLILIGQQVWRGTVFSAPSDP